LSRKVDIKAIRRKMPKNQKGKFFNIFSFIALPITPKHIIKLTPLLLSLSWNSSGRYTPKMRRIPESPNLIIPSIMVCPSLSETNIKRKNIPSKKVSKTLKMSFLGRVTV
jgi:hypothetical protein